MDGKPIAMDPLLDSLTTPREQLAGVIREFYQRGWCVGTGGNFSAVDAADPVRVIITPSGIHKGAVHSDQFLDIDLAGGVLSGSGSPSAETGIHLEILNHFGCERVGSVLHTHSVWNTVLSDRYGHEGGLAIEGLEMLKGLEGVKTHEHREWVPILENAQDIPALCLEVKRVLTEHSGVHGFLLKGHGLYTWGRDILEAKRHVEIFEFLFEVTGHRDTH